mmetsp:Transcript_4466/g.10384  ORF Transcript_4466/g.10384 Transcript_4466/m.10384 type:complete len:125 (+) Transcript_4466:639-1013(+)
MRLRGISDFPRGKVRRSFAWSLRDYSLNSWRVLARITCTERCTGLTDKARLAAAPCPAGGTWVFLLNLLMLRAPSGQNPRRRHQQVGKVDRENIACGYACEAAVCAPPVLCEAVHPKISTAGRL